MQNLEIYADLYKSIIWNKTVVNILSFIYENILF